MSISQQTEADGGAMRLDTIRLDGRTRVAKRVRALVETYAKAMGGWDRLSPIRAQEVERAAVLVTISELAQEKFMRGSELVSPDDLIRCSNAADRAIRRLGIRPDAGAPKLHLYLDDIFPKLAPPTLVELLGPDIECHRTPKEIGLSPPLDFVWFDEEPPQDLYFEGLTRTNATEGMVYLTFTPLRGMSDVVYNFIQECGDSIGMKTADAAIRSCQ